MGACFRNSDETENEMKIKKSVVVMGYEKRIASVM